MRENQIEKHLHGRIDELGGEWRRMAWIGRRHAQDDFVMLPGRHCWVECKRPGEVVKGGQLREKQRMQSAGCEVYAVSTTAEIDAIFPKPN